MDNHAISAFLGSFFLLTFTKRGSFSFLNGKSYPFKTHPNPPGKQTAFLRLQESSSARCLQSHILIPLLEPYLMRVMITATGLVCFLRH